MDQGLTRGRSDNENGHETVARPPDPGWRSAVEAAIIMAVGLGFGRFVFTAAFPQMVQEGVISIQGGTVAASANYTGYLIGALLAMRAKPAQAHKLCLISAVGTALCLAVLAGIHTSWVLALMRGVAGIFSAQAVVGVSMWLLQQKGNVRRAPWQFSGVGIGIALSAELLSLGQWFELNSAAMWLFLGAAALLLGLLAAPGLMAATPHTVPRPTPAAASPAKGLYRVWQLVTVYGVAGFGYIITATYLPLFIKEALEDLNPVQVWAVFGLGAIPSCFLWHWLHGKLGSHRALGLNLGIQAVGVVLPALSQAPWSYLGSALIVGGTYMGAVTVAMSAAQRIAHLSKGNLMGIMTVAYGTGQIVGPIVVYVMFELTQSFSSSLVVAGVSLALASVLAVRRS